MKRLLTVLTVLLFATACTSVPNEGVVTARYYTPAHYDYVWICSAYAKEGYCIVNMPYPVYYADEWQLCFKEGCFAVSQEVCEQTRVGDFYRRT